MSKEFNLAEAETRNLPRSRMNPAFRLSNVDMLLAITDTANSVLDANMKIALEIMDTSSNEIVDNGDTKRILDLLEETKET